MTNEIQCSIVRKYSQSSLATVESEEIHIAHQWDIEMNDFERHWERSQSGLTSAINIAQPTPPSTAY